MSFNLNGELTRLSHEQRLHEAEVARLVRASRSPRPPRRTLRAAFGARLVAAGNWLQTSSLAPSQRSHDC